MKDEKHISRHIQDFHETDEDPSSNTQSYLFSVKEPKEQIRKQNQPTTERPKDDFLVDSGATAHMTHDKSKFVSFQEDFKSAEHKIELADGTITTKIAEKRGTIQIDVRNENGELCKFYLENTLYIPSLPENIFSVKSACEKKHLQDRGGASVHLYGNGGKLVSKDGTGFPIKSRDRLYYLELCQYSESSTKSPSVRTSRAVRRAGRTYGIVSSAGRRRRNLAVCPASHSNYQSTKEGRNTSRPTLDNNDQKVEQISNRITNKGYVESTLIPWTMSSEGMLR